MNSDNPKNSYRLISSNDDVKEICSIIMRDGIVAIDTEFTRTRTYYPMLSTIQMCLVDARIFIFDVESGIRIDDILKIFGNPDIKKIIHAPKQDMEAIYYYSKICPANFIDTQAMASACGIGQQCGYGALVEQFFGYIINKSCQRSKWYIRPLTDAQLSYICDDVRYLLKLYAFLSARLIDRDIDISLFSSDYVIPDIIAQSVKLTKSVIGPLIVDNDTVRSIRKIVILRERIAEKRNLLRKFIVSDDDIMKLAMSRPSSILEIDKMCKIHRCLDKNLLLSMLIESHI